MDLLALLFHDLLTENFIKKSSRPFIRVTESEDYQGGLARIRNYLLDHLVEIPE